MVHLDVVVDIHPCLEPLGILVGTLRQRQGFGPLHALKKLPARLTQPAHGTGVETLQALSDSGIELRQA